MNGKVSSLLNMVMCAATQTPFGVLNRSVHNADSKVAYFYRDVADPLGLPQLLGIMIGFGAILAIIVIAVHLTKLLIVNYPKTVTQTKQKVVHAFFVIIALCSLGLVFDTVLEVVQKAIGL